MTDGPFTPQEQADVLAALEIFGISADEIDFSSNDKLASSFQGIFIYIDARGWAAEYSVVIVRVSQPGNIITRSDSALLAAQGLKLRMKTDLEYILKELADMQALTK